MKPIYPAFVLLIFFLLTPALICEEEPRIKVDDVVITGEADNPAAQSDVITADEIASGGYQTLDQAIRDKTGIVINDNGTIGSLKTVSMRGAPSSQVLILIDGRRPTGGQGSADLSLIPLDNVESVEISRASLGAFFGPDAVGGVINVRLKKTQEKTFLLSIENTGYLPLDFTSGGGIFVAGDPASLIDAQNISFGHSLKLPGCEILTTGSFTRALNGFTFPDDSGVIRKRENAGFLGGHGSVNILIPLNDARLIVNTGGLFQDKGVPGSLALPPSVAEQTDLQATGSFEYDAERFMADTLTFNGKVSYAFSQNGYKEPKYATDSLHTFHQVILAMSQKNYSFDKLVLSYALNSTYDLVLSTDLGQKDRLSASALVSAEWALTDKTMLCPAVRYDLFPQYPLAVTYSLGLVQAITDRIKLKASTGRSYRIPTFNELYWPFSGNPDLLPETAYLADAGIEFGDPGKAPAQVVTVTASVFGFARYLQNGIYWVEQTPMVWLPSNYGDGLYGGVDASVAFFFRDLLSLRVNYTFTRSLLLSGGYSPGDDKRMPYCPAHSLKARIGVETRTDEAGLSLTWQDSQFLDKANTNIQNGYLTLDASYRRNITEDFSMSIQCRNLTGAAYEAVKDYPSPGFSFTVGASIRF
jgi:vitamin B12 transporter